MSNRIVQYTLTAQPYYDSCGECYRNILVINSEPLGPLRKIVKRLNPPKLSPFYDDYSNNCCNTYNGCIYAVYDPNNCGELMCVDNVPVLFSFLATNGYIIDTSLTTMMQKSPVKLGNNQLICFITYSYNHK
jgi:hypothetical protein